jgi:SNF2 family DNA or RNA helicase
MRKPVNIELSEEKLYLLKRRGQKPGKLYGGKEVITFKDYRLLKDFQNEALNWFIQNWYENRNTILADEMGLGKTIQVLAFLYHLHMHERVLGPFLVLAPLTTLHQWRREIEAWTNFNCLLYYDEGQQLGRASCQLYEFHYSYTRRNGQLIQSNIPKFQILLTNYENFIRDFSVLRPIAFQHIVVDEAHKMKNAKTMLATCLRKLPCRRITLMTGTPLQNNTRELWALLNYI